MIGIMGAMSEEIAPILSRLDSYKEVDYADNTFYLSNYSGNDIVVAYSKIGKVNACITACVMIERFKIDTLLFTGVAGALSNNLKIGDLMYATKLAQYDLDITAFGHPLGYVPGINIFSKSDDRLNKLALKIAKEKNIKLLSGVIATGDTFICDLDRKNFIKNSFKADAVEMEGASVAQVCEQLKIPFFILRAISDSASNDAEFDFDKFLQNSANLSAEFILDMIRFI